MAFSYGFYNSKVHDRLYDAVQMSMIFDGLINDGVYATVGQHFIVKKTDEPNVVTVGSGRAWFNHTWNYNDSEMFIDCGPAEVIMGRYDAIVLDVYLDPKQRINSIKCVKGTPKSNNPVKPTLINTSLHKQYPLAYIFRPGDSTSITQSNIENMVGTSACPFVTGIIQTINTDQLLLQWDAAFFEWFSDLEVVLDGNVAGNLYNRIQETSSNVNSLSSKVDSLSSKVDNIETPSITKGTLTAGSTSITINDSKIIKDVSALSFYTSIYAVNPKTVTVNNGSVTLTFDQQTVNMEVGVSVDG